METDDFHHGDTVRGTRPRAAAPASQAGAERPINGLRAVHAGAAAFGYRQGGRGGGVALLGEVLQDADG